LFLCQASHSMRITERKVTESKLGTLYLAHDCLHAGKPSTDDPVPILQSWSSVLFIDQHSTGQLEREPITESQAYIRTDIPAPQPPIIYLALPRSARRRLHAKCVSGKE